MISIRECIILESPYAGRAPDWVPWPLSLVFEWVDRLRNVRFLHRCMRDSMDRGEAPFASHAMYTRALRDRVPFQRAIGMQCGFAWGYAAAKRIVYCDRGVSEGMRQGIEAAPVGQAIEYRYLDWRMAVGGDSCVVCGEVAIPGRQVCAKSRCLKSYAQRKPS